MSSGRDRAAIGRREFLRLTTFTLSASILAACAPGPTTEPVGEGPAVPTAPSGATALPGQAVEPTAVAEPSSENPLIGRFEGPEIVAETPREFHEAPELAELVAQGKLPPVEERIGLDPIVVKPLHEIGEYGGTWRRGFTGPGDSKNGQRACSGPDSLLFFDYTATKVIPNIAKTYTVNEDATEFTLELRRGMRWSDGEPVTADDILFWWEDVQLDTELSTRPSFRMAIDGEYGNVTKVDDFTVLYSFPKPYYIFVYSLTSPSHFANSINGGILPKHYLQQFHATYQEKAELDRMVREAQVEDWTRLFLIKRTWGENVELPVVSPWKCISPRSSDTWVFDRNPYSVWVDTAGNQLPYIDNVVMTLAENMEVLQMRAIAGEYDLQARHIALSKLPVLIENQERGGYRIWLDTGKYGACCAMWICLWHTLDEYVGELLANREFRRAMSMAVDRDELNETFWLGTGVPGSVAPAEDTRYSPGPEWRTKWCTYDPDQASEILDSLGLNERDDNGMRLRADGKGPLIVEIQTKAAQFLEFTQMAEMIKTHWERVGVGVTVKEVERTLGSTREANCETQFSLWTNDGSDDFFFAQASVLPTLYEPFATWINSYGREGTEPYPPLKRMAEIYWQGFGTPDEERSVLGQEFWRILCDEVIQMGIVGQSAAAQGVRVTNVSLGNVPERQYNTPWVINPAISRPQSFYWKNL